MTMQRILKLLASFVLSWLTLLIMGCNTAAKPTTLILARQNTLGDVVIRYVRGEQLQPEGTHVWVNQPVALPRQSGTAKGQISVPSVVLFPTTDRIYVARAIVDGTSNTTKIHVVDSGYATMLAESQPQLALERPGLIDSAVSLTHINGNILLVWKEGKTLKGIRSADGESWSAVESLITLPGDGPFALWSEGNRLYLAFTAAGGTAINVTTSTNGSTFDPNPMIGANLAGPIRGISIAAESNQLFVAYCNSKSVKILRGAIGGTFDTTVDVYTVPLNEPNYLIHAVTVHPSPYGWALQYTASYQSPNGIEYTIFGRRSADGLDYSGTTWTYSSDTRFLGPTTMATTPTPMPWIVKTHDSGQGADAVYNFVITCDGFTYAEKDQFMEAAILMTANITNRAPFFYNKDLFNVWVVNTFSKDSGFDSSDTVNDKDTIFEGYRGSGYFVIARYDGVAHARRVITGNAGASNLYGFLFFNPPEGERVAIPSWDQNGIPMPYDRANSLVPLHEYLHTHAGAGGFALGDHERRNQPSNNINKSFDATLAPMGNHAWQHWFVFGGPAQSRLLEVSNGYRNGLIDWVADGNENYAYHRSHFAYSEDSNSPYYVDALSLFNVGLWESELTDVDDLSSAPQFTALRACAMNSLLHHAQLFCPVCSETIVSHLQSAAGIVDESDGRPFDVAAFQSAPGSYLEFQLKNAMVCDDVDFPPPLNLEDLVVVNGHTMSATQISVYESEDSALYLIGRIDIDPWVTPGSPATITFKQRNVGGGETRIWLPSIQVVNGQGARYPMQPVGQMLIARLHQKHAPECDYEYWDLAEGNLTLTFTPNAIP